MNKDEKKLFEQVLVQLEQINNNLTEMKNNSAVYYGLHNQPCEPEPLDEAELDAECPVEDPGPPPYNDDDLPDLVEKGELTIDDLASNLEYELLTPIPLKITLLSGKIYEISTYESLISKQSSECTMTIPDIEANKEFKRYLTKWESQLDYDPHKLYTSSEQGRIPIKKIETLETDTTFSFKYDSYCRIMKQENEFENFLCIIKGEQELESKGLAIPSYATSTTMPTFTTSKVARYKSGTASSSGPSSY